MNKRLRFALASVFSTCVFLGIFLVPYYIYPKQLLFSVLSLVFVYLALGIRGFKFDLSTLGYLIMPGMYTFGFYQIALLFDKSIFNSIIFSLVNFFVIYVYLLVYNIFFVTQAQKTPALYRSAGTVSMLLSLVVSYLVFNFLWSLRIGYIYNFVLFFIVSLPMFLQVIWVAVVGDEVQKNTAGVLTYVLVPSLVLAQLSVLFSFWPSSIFLSSLYITLAFYICSQLVTVASLEKNVANTYNRLYWIGLVAVISIIFSTNWR